MTKEKKARKILLDAVNRKGHPVLGVKYTIFVDGKEATTAIKARAGTQSVEIVGADEVIVKASLDGWKDEAIRLGGGSSLWKFEFPGAGVPAVLVVCALPKEARAVLATCDETFRLERYAPASDPNTYWVGTYRSIDKGTPARRILLATSGMGNIGAAITATHALRSFPDEIEQVLMVGIAGGCPNPLKPEDHVRLGDIVVANEKGIIQYDFIKRTVDGDEHRANPHRPSKQMMDAVVTLEVDRPAVGTYWDAIIQKVNSKTAEFTRPPMAKDVLYLGDAVVAHPSDSRRVGDNPRVHRGGIGSANILLKDPALRDFVRDKWGVRAIEMEGSGVLDAGWAMDRDVMVVRGICDYCDSHKSDDWQEYAALAAAAYARCLVEALPDRAFP